jgi:hypothetical protein
LGSHQLLEHGELPSGQRDLALAAAHAATSADEKHLAPLELHRRSATTPAIEGLDPRDQLGQGDRLADVVVGAQRQPGHPILDLVGRGQHQDARVGAAIAKPPAEVVAAQSRQPTVEDDDVESVVVEQLDRRLAGGRNLRRDAVVLEPAGECGGELELILDEKNAHQAP